MKKLRFIVKGKVSLKFMMEGKKCIKFIIKGKSTHKNYDERPKL